MFARRPPTFAAAALAALTLLAGCAAPAKPRAALAPRPLSPRRRAANDQSFYRAVAAYVQGDYDEADVLLKGILRADPANKDALALRRRVQAAQRVSAR